MLTFGISWKCVNKEGKDKFGLRFRQKHRGLFGFLLQSVFQFSSVMSLSQVQLFVTPWTMHTMLPVHYQLPEFTQTHVHQVSNAIQPSNPLLSPSPAFNLSYHQGLF